MVSYSRLRPAMSRDEPIRWFFGAAAGAGAVGVALARGGSVPVVLIGSPSGRLARVATDKELLLGRGGVYHDSASLSRLLSVGNPQGFPSLPAMVRGEQSSPLPTRYRLPLKRF